MRRAVAVGIGLGALIGAALMAWQVRSPPPTVVLVVLDTVRPDRLPPWGGDAETAPWLAGLASRSAVFRDAFSTSSWTAPSTASVFTGLYPPQHGVIYGFRAQHRDADAPLELEETTLELRGMPTALATLPELLRDAGWLTIGVAANVNIGSDLGFDRGFAAFERDHRADAEAMAADLTALLPWFDRRPRFLYIHLNDAHHPYRKHRPWYRQARRAGHDDTLARYDSEIRYMDEVLGDLHDALGWDDARIVVVSDHGEAFGEHGQEGHLFSLYGEVNRVALLVHAPGQVPSGEVVGVNASLVDVLPTVLELAGVEVPPDRAGASLVGAAQGRPEALADRVVFAHRASPRRRSELWAAVQGPHKLVAEVGPDPALELFDMAADPGETRDLAAERPDLAAALAAALDAFRFSAVASEGPRVEVDLDDALYEHLEAMGYVGDD